MNGNIRTICKASDKEGYHGRSPRNIAMEALHHLRHAVPYSTDDLESLKPLYPMPEERKAIEAELKAKFEQWAETWIAPKLRAIMAKGHPNFKNK